MVVLMKHSLNYGLGLTSGNISSAASNILETMKTLGKSPLESKEELFEFLDPNNESTLMMKS